MKNSHGIVFLCVVLMAACRQEVGVNSAFTLSSEETSKNPEAGKQGKSGEEANSAEAVINEVEYSLVWTGFDNPAYQDSPGGDEASIVNLRITHKNKPGDPLKELSSSLGDYEQLLKYCAFEIQKDVSLVNGSGDTIPCLFSHYERTYGIIPGMRFQFAFEPDLSQHKQLTFVLDDRLYGNGPIKFRIKN